MKILTYLKSHAVLSGGIAIVAVAGMIIAGRVAQRESAPEANTSNIKKVTLVSVDNFRDDLSKVSADGIVESVSQVDLKSQMSAPLSIVNVSVGDTVYVGQTIAVLQNADIRAQLDQAKAGLQLAEGQYAGSGISLDSARKSALETIRSSYLTADEIVNIQLEQFLYRSSGGNPQLSELVTDQQLSASIRTLFLDSKGSFSSWKKSLDTLTINSDEAKVLEVITLSQANLQKLSMLLDDISAGISDAIRGLPASDTYNAVNVWQAVVTAARASTNVSMKGLTGAQAALSGAQVTYESPAEAQISSARAAVKGLEAQLAKTVITSPITGKIAALPLRVGELAQPGQLIATVVGGGGLQVKAYASPEDLLKIKAGAKALIQNTILATVASVAPSVNQVNKKIEVKISVDNPDASGLVIGQSVSLSIESSLQASSTISKNNNYILPIQNVKIVPGAAYVFTVDDSSKIVKNPVILGKIQGDFVEITSGITSEMKIVSPVYELEEGNEVNYGQ